MTENIKAIDFMGYLFTKEYFSKYWLTSPDLMRVASWWKFEDIIKRGWSVDEFVELMDEAGVEKHCMAQLKMFSYKYKKLIVDVKIDEIAKVIEKHPDRFVGFAGINPLKKMEGVRELEIAIKDYGFKAAYLHFYGFGIPPNHRLLYPFYAKCAELGVPVSMQVGHSAELMPSKMGRPIYMDDVALDFPELTLIGSHTGWPWVEELIALAWKHDNVYICMDAHLPRYWDKGLVNFLKGRGQDKVLFGTNGPLTFMAKDFLRQIEDLRLKEEVKKKFLRENAIKILKL
jgi:predicted TIM-barrel fold metal-dependent hydrolase